MAIASAINDVWEVVIEGRQEGQLTDNVFHFKTVGATADVDLHLIQVLLQCFITNLLPVLSSAWNLERVKWKRLSPTLGVEQISIPTGTTTGGGSAVALPTFCAAVISKRTLTGGRSYRGRTYIPGIPEDATTGSTINPGSDLWAGLLGFALCVINNFVHPDPAGATNAFDLVVWSRVLQAGNVPFPLNATNAVREYVPVGQLGTMRSRKIGHGA